MSKKPRGNRWTGWFNRKPSLLRPFPALRCEELEARAVPATYTWTGAGADNNWSTDLNWMSSLGGAFHPTGNTGTDDLVFPEGPSVRTTVNDLTVASGTPTFNSI